MDIHHPYLLKVDGKVKELHHESQSQRTSAFTQTHQQVGSPENFTSAKNSSYLSAPTCVADLFVELLEFSQ